MFSDEKKFQETYDIYCINNIVKFDKLRIAYSGTHGTGKTTSVFNCAKHCKINFSNKSVHVITETASESPFKINKSTTEDSQTWIFIAQMKAELECFKYDILISDRTVVDCISYSIRAGFNKLADSQLEMAKSYISKYDYIFYKSIEKNDYLFEDGIRDSKDINFRKEINNYLLEIYQKLIPYMKRNDVFQII